LVFDHLNERFVFDPSDGSVLLCTPHRAQKINDGTRLGAKAALGDQLAFVDAVACDQEFAFQMTIRIRITIRITIIHPEREETGKLLRHPAERTPAVGIPPRRRSESTLPCRRALESGRGFV